MTTEKANEISARIVSEQADEALKKKDKKKWLSFFADDAIIEDPVGKSPFDPEGKGRRGKEAIGAFWDEIIAHHTIVYDFKESHDTGKEIAYVGSIYVTGEKGSIMGKGASVRVDCVAIYKINDDGKIVALRIFWEFEKTMATLKVP